MSVFHTNINVCVLILRTFMSVYTCISARPWLALSVYMAGSICSLNSVVYSLFCQLVEYSVFYAKDYFIYCSGSQTDALIYAYAFIFLLCMIFTVEVQKFTHFTLIYLMFFLLPQRCLCFWVV